MLSLLRSQASQCSRESNLLLSSLSRNTIEKSWKGCINRKSSHLNISSGYNNSDSARLLMKMNLFLSRLIRLTVSLIMDTNIKAIMEDWSLLLLLIVLI
jgi:hypothetical protein